MSVHPQRNELRAAIVRFLADPDAYLEVHCPDHERSVELLHVKSSSGLEWPAARMFTVGRLWTSAPNDAEVLARAERKGFIRTARRAQNPKTLQFIEVPKLEARFINPDDGTAWCLAALQDIHGIGDAWLWITNLSYSDWPNPLPKPDPWPPC